MGVVNNYSESLTSTGGNGYYQGTPTSLAVVKAAPGRLCRIHLVTVNGANAIAIFDNASAASGTQIATVAASAAAGTVLDLQIPVVNGITIAATASAATLVVTFI